MVNITIKDIAKALGLSASTVSRALRDSYEIGEATKKRVHAYAKEHNYSPNPIALGLKENKTRAIGILVPEVDNPFFSQAINGIESIAYEHGYHVMIFQSYESLEREKFMLKQLAARRVDGVIMSVSAQTESYEHIQDLYKQIPIVMFDRVIEGIHSHKVVSNSFSAAYKATEYLIKRGKKRIAVIGIPAYLSIWKERYGGFLAALQQHGIAIDNALLKDSGYEARQIENDIKALLAMDPKPDAIFSMSDRQALTCLAVFKKLGVKLPDDIAYFCFSNLKMAELFNPPLSTISQPAFEMGQKSGKLLIELLESKHPERIELGTVRIDSDIHVRDSSG